MGEGRGRGQGQGQAPKGWAGAAVRGALLDARTRHAVICPHGYVRVHTAMVAAVANEAARAGGDVDLERYVPELARQKVEVKGRLNYWLCR